MTNNAHFRNSGGVCIVDGKGRTPAKILEIRGGTYADPRRRQIHRIAKGAVRDDARESQTRVHGFRDAGPRMLLIATATPWGAARTGSG